MKIITLLSAILWAVITLLNLYNLAEGSYPLRDVFLESPIIALNSVVFFLTYVAMTAFFFILWLKQK